MSYDTEYVMPDTWKYRVRVTAWLIAGTFSGSMLAICVAAVIGLLPHK